MRHGGKILIDQLEIQGATTAFTVPGESFLAALDGLHDSNRIKTIICRQEGGASMMAEAWGKITGEPGICFVTRGPGAANAMSGLHVATAGSTPMVTFVGMPSSGHEDREAFQEIEIKQVFSSFVKWAAVIRQTTAGLSSTVKPDWSSASKVLPLRPSTRRSSPSISERWSVRVIVESADALRPFIFETRMSVS